MNNHKNQFLACLSYLGLNPDQELVAPHVRAMKSCAQLPIFNRVCGDENTTAQDISAVTSYYSDMPHSWVVDAANTTLHNVLEAHDYTKQESLSIKHRVLDEAISLQDVEGLVIAKITDIDEIAEWVSVASRIFDLDEIECAQFVSYLVDTVSAQQIHFYSGYYQDAVVAIGVAIDYGTITLVDWVGVDVDNSAQEMYQALLANIFADAQARGACEVIMPGESTFSSVYGTLGLQECMRVVLYQ